MQTGETYSKNNLGGLSLTLPLALLCLACLAYGFSLDHYPSFGIDDPLFAYPGLKAYLGGPFTYPVSAAAPFKDILWAYHGPILPHLLEVLYKLFGFSILLTRLPNFIGGWVAALLITIFLHRRGYRYAGLCFAILWIGDRSVQEIVYGRPEGLALLSVVVSFLFLERAWKTGSSATAFGCGTFCGLSPLIHPICLWFAVVSLLLVFLGLKREGGLWFLAGALLNVPLLFLLWNFDIHNSATQFLWNTNHIVRTSNSFDGFLQILPILRWSRFWFASLVAFSLASALVAARLLLTMKREMSSRTIDFILAASFGLASLKTIIQPSVHPYYLVYFSIWPILCLVLVAENYWRQTRVFVVLMFMVWCSSVCWNALRFRESIKYYKVLDRGALYAKLREIVPNDGEIVATPTLYAVPYLAGFSHFSVTTFIQEQQNVCPECYLLMTEQQYDAADFVARSSLARRQVLYSGPAFPGAHFLEYPIVILSPETVPLRN